MRRIAEPELMDLPEEAAAYAAADFAEVNAKFVQRLLELAGGHETAVAIDLGTGPADIPIRLARHRPAWTILAVDASVAMLDLARRTIAGAGLTRQVALLLGDVKALAVPDAAFDVAFSNSILHHVSDPAALWREIKRVAKSGAIVLLRDLARPDNAQAARDITRLYAGGESPLLQEEFYRSLLSSYTVDEVRQQLIAAGLANLQVAMVSDRHLDVGGRISG